MIPVPSPAGSVTELRFLRSTPVERQLHPVQIHYKVETDKIILKLHQARSMGLNKATAQEQNCMQYYTRAACLAGQNYTLQH